MLKSLSVKTLIFTFSLCILLLWNRRSHMRLIFRIMKTMIIFGHKKCEFTRNDLIKNSSLLIISWYLKMFAVFFYCFLFLLTSKDECCKRIFCHITVAQYPSNKRECKIVYMTKWSRTVQIESSLFD